MDHAALESYVNLASIAPGLTVTLTSTTPEPYPYFNIMTRTSTLSMVFTGEVQDSNGETHVVVASYQLKDGEPDFGIWCGDKFLEGRDLSHADALARCQEATQGMSGAKALKDRMMALYNQYTTSAHCTFWADWRRDKKLCAHTQAFLAYLKQNVTDFPQQLSNAFDEANGNGPVVAPGEVYSLDELAFRVPVLFEGERGAGKTVEARTFARTYNYPVVEVGGFEGMESVDLLGYLVPFDKSNMVWMDGPLTEAFRAAGKGKVVLIIDELLRIRQRELSILLTALSPDNGVYRLRTGRILSVDDGVARAEVLECPVENLCVIATTNVGSEYAVDDIDPALAERFIILRKDTTVAELKRILTSVAAAAGLPETTVTKCITFYQKMVESCARGLVHNKPTTRTLARALQLASSSQDVKRALQTQTLLWVARDHEGLPVKEQVEDIKKMLDRIFK